WPLRRARAGSPPPAGRRSRSSSSSPSPRLGAASRARSSSTRPTSNSTATAPTAAPCSATPATPPPRPAPAPPTSSSAPPRPTTRPSPSPTSSTPPPPPSRAPTPCPPSPRSPPPASSSRRSTAAARPAATTSTTRPIPSSSATRPTSSPPTSPTRASPPARPSSRRTPTTIAASSSSGTTSPCRSAARAPRRRRPPPGSGTCSPTSSRGATASPTSPPASASTPRRCSTPTTSPTARTYTPSPLCSSRSRERAHAGHARVAGATASTGATAGPAAAAVWRVGQREGGCRRGRCWCRRSCAGGTSWPDVLMCPAAAATAARRCGRRPSGEGRSRRALVCRLRPSCLGQAYVLSATTNSSSSSAFVSTDARAAVESLTVYKYSELEKATAGFSEDRRVKDASVYRAVINGDAAAVKRVAGDVSGEVGILKRVNHSSLVRLSGLCVHHGDTYLVFEFAENGALSNWLHGGGDTLVWKQRVQAAFDVADGLNYLHHYSNPPCVHKNLKSSNVLLDADLRAKVSSFALARSVPTGVDGGDAQLTRHVVGTQGYLAPEYLEHGLITPKLDVFAFGVILLELLSGKEATFDGGAKRGETLLWESAEGLVVDGEDARGKVRAFMDSRLNGDYPLDLAVAVASLAVRCVAREPRGRPSMDEVFVTLSAVYNSTLDWDPSDYSNSRSSIVGR
uniref:Protein kinase domain-containing protein n=1 Tax=Aegilops tauschii subsp. strangulata TaxID=200361 RepID=A0A453NNH1_AEGTS